MALLNEKRRRRRIPLAAVPPPTTPSYRPVCTSPGDDDDGTLARLEAEAKASEEAECATGIDWPEGPISPQGCAW